MKDLIIGAYTNYDWNQIKNWVNSIKLTNFSGDIVLIAFNTTKETVDILKSKNVEVLTINDTLDYKSKLPIHVERFIFIYHFIKNRNYRYVLTTDVKDVIFQLNPFIWLEKNIENKRLVVSSESIIYNNEPWGNENLNNTFGKYIYNELFKKEIFNVGVIAGEFEYVKDLCLHLFTMSTNRPIPIVDQAVFNFLIHTYPWKDITKFVKSEDGWACQLGTTADPNKIESFKPFLLEKLPMIKGDEVYTSTEIKYSVVHQYDRVFYLKEKIDKKYA
jgi:hypothetical protein